MVSLWPLAPGALASGRIVYAYHALVPITVLCLLRSECGCGVHVVPHVLHAIYMAIYVQVGVLLLNRRYGMRTAKLMGERGGGGILPKDPSSPLIFLTI